jgi:hypothetical protein
MDHHRDLYGYGQSDYLEQQQDSSPYDAPHGGDPVEGWVYDESFRHEPDLPNTSHAQPTTAINPECDGIPSSLGVYPTSSRSDCHASFGDIEEGYSSPTWPALHEAIETPDWMQASDTIAAHGDSCQEIGSGARAAEPFNAISLGPPYNAPPPQGSSLAVAFELASGEHTRPPAHAPQPGPVPLRAGRTEENLPGGIVL